MKKILLLVTLTISQLALALPIDWSGTFALDFSRIVNYNRSDDSTAPTVANDSQLIDTNGFSNLAIFQNYVLKLNPTIIVNDSVSVFGQLTTGANQGGFFGDDTALSNTAAATNSGFVAATRNANGKGLNVNLIYTELYTDTALYRIGKFTKHWGMGALFNNGKKSFDRFQSIFDGAEAELNFGKLIMTPYWAKFNTESLTRDTDYSEMGVTLLYDNPDKNMLFGILYSSRSAGSSNTLINGAAGVQGNISVNLIDIYAKKEFGKFTFELEVPMMTGNAGNIYTAVDKQNYQTTSVLADLKYEKSKKWLFGLLVGSVKGDDATSDDFGATYLHPNFQIAELMFKYNLSAVAGTSAGSTLYDSSISNAKFAKLYSSYYTNNWTLNFALIMAKADQVASAGDPWWNHEAQAYVNAAGGDQSDDMGVEFDFSFDYNWNTSTVFSGYFGYHNVGEYYAYDGAAGDIDLTNSYTFGMRLGIDF